MTRMLRTMSVAILCGGLVSPAAAAVADHLKCYKIKDSAPKASYTANLGGLVPEPGCKIAVPGKMLCVETTKTGVTPNPPGPAGSAGQTGRFLCYKLKCTKAALTAVPWSDQFGTRTVTPIGAKLLCAPESVATTTTTSTTSTTLGAPSCTDAVKNGTETDVDCGGGACPPCAQGKMCLAGSDCTTNLCMAGVCQGPTCTDLVKDGAETDVDCGGGTCPACTAGKMCGTGSDCTSLVCAGGTCQAPSCADGVKNGNETDVDCGGGTCALCAATKMCVMNGDCLSNNCMANVCQ